MSPGKHKNQIFKYHGKHYYVNVSKMKRPWWLHWPWNWVKALDQNIDDMIDQLGDILGHDREQKRMEDYC